MMELIINCYMSILLLVGFGSSVFFLMGLYFILKRTGWFQKRDVLASKIEPSVSPLASEDVFAISGDDMIATQLDLARAYIEAGRSTLAKNILEFIAEQGSLAQQQEVQRLMTVI